MKEISEQTSLNTSTAFRIVNTLERRQYLTRNESSKQYRLGPKALALGYSSHWTENVVTLAKPYLRRLQQIFNETASIYVAEGDNRICLDHVESTHSLRRVIPMGESLPIYKGAAGKVLWRGPTRRNGIVSSYNAAIFRKMNLRQFATMAMLLRRTKVNMASSLLPFLFLTLKNKSSHR